VGRRPCLAGVEATSYLPDAARGCEGRPRRPAGDSRPAHRRLRGRVEARRARRHWGLRRLRARASLPAVGWSWTARQGPLVSGASAGRSHFPSSPPERGALYV